MSGHIDVRFFAVVAERTGLRQDTLTLAQAATVDDAITTLAARHEAIAELRNVLAVAVNDTFVQGHHTLQDGDVLAIIPPVSGG